MPVVAAELEGTVDEVRAILGHAFDQIIPPADTLAELAHWLFHLPNKRRVAAVLADYLNSDGIHPRYRLILAKFMYMHQIPDEVFEGAYVAARFVTFLVGMAESVVSTAVIAHSIPKLATAMEQTEPEAGRPFLWLAVSMRRDKFGPESRMAPIADYADQLLTAAFPQASSDHHDH